MTSEQERQLAKKFITENAITFWMDDDGEPHESDLQDVVEFIREIIRLEKEESA